MRELNISTGENRHSVQWQKTRTTWDALCERLRVPVRGVETLDQYMRLSKPQQDARKDVGGFVAGTLDGSRRLRTKIISRDIITLDLDNVPGAEIDAIFGRLNEIGSAYAVYSTRKHRPEAPRLRVLIPLDRSVNPDEYEAISRKIAEDIGMQFMDRTTFEPHRLMYWPSCCSDGVYLFRTGGSGELSADDMLARYGDWKDRATWPAVPGEILRDEEIRKKQDPKTVSGIVGAFCRQYTISEAIDAFLSDVYAPSDADGSRYTYTKGSTFGGALVYDDMFLYSYHGTDPCCGSEVNAYDMIRLHKFGKLDEVAAPKTPINRLPSHKAMKEWALAIPSVAGDLNRERGAEQLGFKKLADDVDRPALQEFLGSLDGTALQEATIARLLELLHITIRKNDISDWIDLDGYPAEWSRENAENLLPTYLQDFLRPAGVYGAGKSDIADRLDVIAEKHRYNPVMDMISATEWDHFDRVPLLYSMWGVSDPFSQMLIYKWLIQCIAMAENGGADPHGAEGVLVLQGAQGVGKTSALRCLVPVPGMFREGAALDLGNKDSVIRALSCWICELGELDRTTFKDSAGLKAFLTDSYTEYRAPYARKATRHPRRTSFCGSVNVGDYLIDDTGNRRFWTVTVEDIKTDIVLTTSRDWYCQLWRQIYEIYLDDPDAFRLSKEERAQLEARNLQHSRESDGEAELMDILNWDLPADQWGEFTAAQISARLSISPGGARMSARQIGRILRKIERTRSGVSSRLLRGRRLYRIPMPAADPS